MIVFSDVKNTFKFLVMLLDLIFQPKQSIIILIEII